MLIYVNPLYRFKLYAGERCPVLGNVKKCKYLFERDCLILPDGYIRFRMKPFTMKVSVLFKIRTVAEIFDGVFQSMRGTCPKGQVPLHKISRACTARLYA